MFFVLAKILGFFALPSNVFVVLGLIGLLLQATRFARTGRRLAVTSLVLLALFGWTPLGNILILPLEQRFPAWQEGGGRPPDGIVVLGGVFDTLVSEARGAVALTDAAERMTVVVELARTYPNARIVFSGGSGRLLLTAVPESVLARILFDMLGIQSRVDFDARARDTLENAVFSKEIAQPLPGERWLLVTSAYHMPRSIGAFRRAGFAVEAYPVDWRTRGPVDVTRPFDALADGLKRSDTAMREWIGLVTYWVTGRTSELFPGPARAGCDTSKEECRP